MQLAANQKLVRNRMRLGMGLYAVSIAVLVGGLIVTNRAEAEADFPLIAWLTMPIGVLLWAVALSQLRRWGPHQRQTAELSKAIRGLDDRYKLYAFLSSSLPDYVLVGPGGVQVIVAKSEGGPAVCERDRWKKPDQNVFTSLFGQPFGNPTADAQRQLEKLRRALAQDSLSDVPSSALIVFTNPKAHLRLEGNTVTVTKVKELRDVLRRLAGKGQGVALSAARVRDVQAAFDRRLQHAHGWR